MVERKKENRKKKNKEENVFQPFDTDLGGNTDKCFQMQREHLDFDEA